MSTSPAEREPSVFDLQPDRAQEAIDLTVEETSETPAVHDAEPPPDGLSSPTDYLVELCELHQVVLVGDRAGVAQHLETLAASIAPLHASGITNFAWEYTNSRAQPELDALISADSWSDRACSDLFVDLLGVGFAYQEYADVLRAAWQVNTQRDPTQPPLRFVGLGVPSYVEDPDLLDGRSAGELELRNWWMGGHYRDLTAFHMANVLTKEVLRSGERVLVYCDVAHTTTDLIEWIDGLATTSLGNLLHRWMGRGVRRVLFHGATDDGEAVARVEELIEAAPEDVSTLGIDLERSTLGNVGLQGVVGSIDGTQTTFRLRNITDGYLFVVPRAAWRPCALIEDFITPHNFMDVEARYRALDPRDEHYSFEELEEVREEGRAMLSNGWPTLPEPVDPAEKRGRFRRR